MGLQGCKISRNSYLPKTAKTAHTQLSMESNLVWMTETGNSFHAFSVYQLEGGGAPVSQTPMTTCFQYVTHLLTVQARPGLQSNTLCIQEAQKTSTMWSYIISFKDGVWQTSKIGLNYSTKGSTKMSELCRTAFKLPTIRIREVRVTSAQTITPSTGTLWRYGMQAVNVRSPQSLQTRTFPSQYCTQNRDSSKKTTLCDSCVQLCCSTH